MSFLPSTTFSQLPALILLPLYHYLPPPSFISSVVPSLCPISRAGCKNQMREIDHIFFFSTPRQSLANNSTELFHQLNPLSLNWFSPSILASHQSGIVDTTVSTRMCAGTHTGLYEKNYPKTCCLIPKISSQAPAFSLKCSKKKITTIALSIFADLFFAFFLLHGLKLTSL